MEKGLGHLTSLTSIWTHIYSGGAMVAKARDGVAIGDNDKSRCGVRDEKAIIDGDNSD